MPNLLPGGPRSTFVYGPCLHSSAGIRVHNQEGRLFKYSNIEVTLRIDKTLKKVINEKATKTYDQIEMQKVCKDSKVAIIKEQ
jgi:hypothetical protein